MVADNGFSGKNMERPALTQALEYLAAGKYEGLVVAKLDRLSRSVMDFADLLDRSRREGWALVTLDLGVDTTTSAGKMVSQVVAVIAEFERERISERITAALAAKKRRGERLGRPTRLAPKTRDLIWRMRRDGLTLREIASRLNADGISTATGQAPWGHGHVSDALRTVELDREAAGQE